MVGFGVLQQQINLIRRFFSNPQTPDSGITPLAMSAHRPSMNSIRGNGSTLHVAGECVNRIGKEISGIWVYSPFLASTFDTELTHLAPGAPRAFLLSPILFGSFLSNHIDGKTFQFLVSESYAHPRSSTLSPGWIGNFPTKSNRPSDFML